MHSTVIRNILKMAETPIIKKKDKKKRVKHQMGYLRESISTNNYLTSSLKYQFEL